MQKQTHIAFLAIKVFLFALGMFCLFTTALAASPFQIENSSPENNIERGWTYFRSGDHEKALAEWLKAAQAYQNAKKIPQQIQVLTYLAQLYQSIGQYKNSSKTLALALVVTEQSGDRTQLASIMNGLGNVSLAIGSWDEAEHYFRQALNFARETNDRAMSGSIYNNLGNLSIVQKNYADGIAAYRESAKLAQQTGNRLLEAQALANAAMASLQQSQYETAAEFLENSFKVAGTLEPSSDKVFTLLNIGLTYDDLSRRIDGDNQSFIQVAGRALNESLTVARTIGDRRSESYALGYLGSLYEKEKRYEEALRLTRQAVLASQQVNSPEALYRWQWQTGRLLKAQGNFEEAISAYRRAVRTLQSIRQEMAVNYGNLRSTFRESVGPVYFELVDLLLQNSSTLQDRAGHQSLLVEARDTVELFKAAELKDYFHDDCVDAARARITKLDIVTQSAVVIYPIMLPDRLELLVSLPAGLKRISVPVPSDVLTREIREFRRKLEKRTTREYLPHAQKLYDWLVRPLESELNSVKTEALVFVPDGPLRTIPMSALHDGKEFLIGKYPVAMTPGIDLTDPRPLKRENVKVLALGLTEAVQGFPALPYVSGEIEAIQSFYGADRLLNQEFIVSKVEQELKNSHFNMVHIASHGQFSSDVDKTFLLTFDDKLTMDRLDRYIGLFRFRDDPLELLTLSACETASGDDRAALGLAGIAIKAGARSAVATLWFINDQATSMLITDFYRELQDVSVSRAVALQRAQTRLLNDKRYQHPGYWSPFLLINNWL